VTALLEELLRLGVKVAVITGTNFNNIDRQFSSLIKGTHKQNLADIEASSSVGIEIVYDRLNRRKIDLIPEWQNPPKSCPFVHGSAIRIISARKATAKERRSYFWRGTP
ncbi:MAG: hypothetical protein M1455_07915, partial [Actinobacteria bacterium]|nr:hypothetical protein [Actinomycetota bacterium]